MTEQKKIMLGKYLFELVAYVSKMTISKFKPLQHELNERNEKKSDFYWFFAKRQKSYNMQQQPKLTKSFDRILFLFELTESMYFYLAKKSKILVKKRQ